MYMWYSFVCYVLASESVFRGVMSSCISDIVHVVLFLIYLQEVQ